MKWELKEIEIGDMVRIPMSEVYHYGVCTGEDRIIQFGEPVLGRPSNSEEIKVGAVTIAEFLKGAFAEVAVFDKKELKRKKTVEEIIEKAESSLGKGGYDILYNNCEHFANECVFGVHSSSHVDDVRKEVEKKLPTINIFVGKVDAFKDASKLPSYVKKAIKSISNETVKAEKKSGYGLLGYALDHLGIKADVKKCFLGKTGKPLHKDCYFSISHSSGLVVVAVSLNAPVGVDIEEYAAKNRVEKLKSKILAENEECQDELVLWTVKEAAFKFSEKESGFKPKEIVAKDFKSKSVKIEDDNKEFVISVVSNIILKVNYYDASSKDELSVKLCYL